MLLPAQKGVKQCPKSCQNDTVHVSKYLFKISSKDTGICKYYIDYPNTAH